MQQKCIHQILRLLLVRTSIQWKVVLIFRLRSRPLPLWIQHILLVKTHLSVFSSSALLRPALLLYTRGAVKEHVTWWTSDFLILTLDLALSLDTRRFLSDVGVNKGTWLRLRLNSRAVYAPAPSTRKKDKCPPLQEPSYSVSGCQIKECSESLAFSLSLNPMFIFSFPQPYIPLPLLCVSLESHHPTSSPEYKAPSVHDPTPWPNAESFSSALRACSAWQCLCL